jgi:DNA ligase (NAD+)
MTAENRNPPTSTVLTQDEFQQAVGVAKQAAKAYYDTETLLMSDSEYDSLVDRLAEAKQANPDWDDAGVLTQVAAGASAGGSLRHPEPMLSLDKSTELSVMSEFVAGMPGPCILEMKLDGNAVRAGYSNGRLVTLATRGDGMSGEPLDASLLIDGLPHTTTLQGEVTVTGEVYMTDDDFERSNTNRVASGKPGFAKPRNAASGVLRRETETFEAFLSFASYHASSTDLDMIDDYQQRMAKLADHGIRTVQSLQKELELDTAMTTDAAEIARQIEEMQSRRASLPVGMDGAVVKVVSYALRETIGVATRHPRWAMAYKYPPLEATSYLVDIEVGVGRTGQMTLRGVLDPPVELDGSMVKYATLHNPTFLAEQNLNIGSRALVTLQGAVIPRIAGGLGDQPKGVTPWQPPSDCPNCGNPWDTSQVLWRCHTHSCGLSNRIQYAAHRDVLDIDGLGEEIAVALVESKLVSDLADLFSLSAEQIASTQIGMTPGGKPKLIGETIAGKIAEGIVKAKQQPLNRVICSLGIPKMGQTMSRRLAAHFGSLSALRAADAPALMEVEGVAAEKAAIYLAGLKEMSDVIDRLITAGVTTEVDQATAPDGVELPLAGKTYVVSGSVPGYTRTSVNERIEALGGKASSSVSTKTTGLVTAETGTSKAKKAAEMGIPVIDPVEFAKLLA